ncbi:MULTISPECIES: cysteine peptidase family C39 domain-containing protein [unclassified Synechococcus]|nr:MULTISPECIES: cysteine peptidase family C39 domain-containing protein [unclassified Synechococcus]EAQ75402.1 ATP-dependent Clp protease adaptor protein ClpS [Synechococcus sp. WH 5701]WFN59889.1 cysteine peptidase family C39 domain-containing protein [Synechococcus sp. CCFWC 502]
MRRYAFVEQHSEEDCGAACQAMIAQHYGKKVSPPPVPTSWQVEAG